MATRRHADDLRGAVRLAVEATRGVSELVEAMQRVIGGGPALLGEPLARPARILSGLVHAPLRSVTGLVGDGLDAALALLAPILGESVPGFEREALRALLNGVVGDHLAATNNPLAIEPRLRRDGRALALEAEALRAALPEASGRILVMVHGLCCADLGWKRRGHDHGAALARDLGYTTVYAHYNSGLHVSHNGLDLAELLEQLVLAWPAPIEELTLLAHSMGGLVARSACHHGERSAMRWRSQLSRLVCLGTPHHGAPLERGGNWVGSLLGVSRYSAPFQRLARLRSAGVTDLRFGNVLAEHWQGQDRFANGADPRRALALPDGVECYAVAAISGHTPEGSDGLVPLDSALGKHPRAELTLRFSPTHQRVIYGTNHLGLLDSAEVSDCLRAWMSADLTTTD